MGQGRHYEGLSMGPAYAKLMWITISQVGFAHSHLGQVLQRAWQCKQAVGTEDGMFAKRSFVVRETETYLPT